MRALKWVLLLAFCLAVWVAVIAGIAALVGVWT
jgi:hypothetical protein